MIREVPAGETATVFAAMRELRTHLDDPAAFARHVDEVQRPQGYRLVAAFADGDEQAAAVAGFRAGTSLSWRRYVYVDDLSTRAAHRRGGHARALLDWVVEEARRQGCEQVHLDSGVGLDRADAHRLYLNSGFVIASHHFARRV